MLNRTADTDRYVDFQHDGMRHQWTHPETGVTIDCDQMPAELTPEHR